jgi:hypothetical protein
VPAPLDRGLDDGFVLVQAAVARDVDDQNGILSGAAPAVERGQVEIE